MLQMENPGGIVVIYVSPCLGNASTECTSRTTSNRPTSL